MLKTECPVLSEADFNNIAIEIQKRHRTQTVDTILQLRLDYAYDNHSRRMFQDPISVWDAIMSLAFVNDPTDKQLKAISQLTHTIQVVDSMHRHGVTDEEFFIAAWLHDLGKILLNGTEDPANIVCLNIVIEGEPKAGLDNCICTWNHDDYAFQKFQNLVPEHIAWLLRYHSLNLKEVEPYLNHSDNSRVHDLLIPFSKHDKLSKSLYHFPKINLDWHRRIIEKHLPEKVIL